MKPKTLDILCDPLTHKELKIVLRDMPNGSTREFLQSDDSGAAYPLRRGIPVFLDQEKTKGGSGSNYRFYGMVAPFYDILHSIQAMRKGGERAMREQYLKELDISGNSKVLEVSIGTGANLRYLPRDAKYFGVDISWDMLKRCSMLSSRSGIDSELVLAEAENLPFVNNAFDAVFNALSFRLINDKAKALAEMVRVAKPGAKIIIADQLKTGAPVELLPRGVKKVKVKEVDDWGMYCLSFIKGLNCG